MNLQNFVWDCGGYQITYSANSYLNLIGGGNGARWKYTPNGNTKPLNLNSSYKDSSITMYGVDLEYAGTYYRGYFTHGYWTMEKGKIYYLSKTSL